MKPTADIQTLRRLLAQDGRAVLLIRHSERYPLPAEDDTFGFETALTPHGEQMAELFGTLLGPYRDVDFLSSPIRRCQQTAKAIASGMGYSNPLIKTEEIIGGDNLFFKDRRGVFLTMRKEGSIQTMTRYLLTGRAPHHNPIKSAAQTLDAWLTKRRANRLTVIVSHDSVCASYYVGIGNKPDFSADDWVPYLGGVLLAKLPKGEWQRAWFAPSLDLPLNAFKQ